MTLKPTRKKGNLKTRVCLSDIRKIIKLYEDGFQYRGIAIRMGKIGSRVKYSRATIKRVLKISGLDEE